MPSERADAPAGGGGLLDARQVLREVIEPEPVPEQPPGWSLREAFAALEGATERDEALRVLLRYTRDFLDAAAIFAVTPEAMVGVDAVGWPEARARCRSIRIDPQAESLLAAVFATRGPSLGPAAHVPANEQLLAGLGRAWPAVALVVPLVVRDRVVCLLYADNGDAPISGARIGDLLLAAGAAGAALERVLLHAKALIARDTALPARDERGWRVREPPPGLDVPASDAGPTSVERAPDEFTVVEPRPR